MNAKTAECPPKSVLNDFGLGILDERAAETLSEHLETCADCRHVVDRMTGDSFVDRMRAAVGAAPPAPAQSAVDGESSSSAAGSSETPTTDGADAASRGPSSSQAAASLPLPPELLASPDYEIVRALGQGGMGTVYLARNRMMDRLEVLKLVSKSLLERPGALERFQQEIRSAARLLHPNIVAAHSVPRLGDLLVFAMEYVDGQDLAQVVKRRGPLPVTNATFYIHQVALGLQHAYEKGMVHRDIKPSNLMLAIENKKHVVKILDFGLAKATSEKTADEQAADAGLTKTGQILGTPHYIAPEQMLDAHQADIRADVYSLGCTLYFLLSGRPPFHGKSMYEILQAHHQTHAQPLNVVRPDVPADLAAVVAKMMAKRPENRYQVPAEVAKALGPFFKTPAAAGAKSDLPAPAVPPAGVAAAPIPILVQPPSATSAHAVPQKPSAAVPGMPARPQTKTKAGRRRLGPPMAIGLLLIAFAIAGALIFKFRATDGVVVVKVNVPNPDVLVDGNRMTVTWDNGGKQAEIRVPPGSRTIELKKDGFQAFGRTVAIADGGEELLTATLEPLVPSPATKPSAGFGAPAFQQWVSSVAALPADKQAAAVAQKLQELNPGFDGQVTPKIENGSVAEISFFTDHVQDISPVRAFPMLKSLTCSGRSDETGDRVGFGHGKLSDLSPLRGMQLTGLNCSRTQVSNLSPLKGMKLTWLHCGYTPVSDFSPLESMPLTSLYCPVTAVSDLSPLAGMPLTELSCWSTKISDISQLKGLPLKVLYFGPCESSDLSPLAGMSLVRLSFTDCPVSDLSPLEGMPLTYLDCDRTLVSDLSPLAGMPLKELRCCETRVSDLTPLERCPGLKLLKITRTETVAKSLATLQTALPNCSIQGDAAAKPKTPEAMAGLPVVASAKVSPRVDASTTTPTFRSPAAAPAPAIAPFDAKQARTYQQAWARHLGVPVVQTDSIGIKLVVIPPGEFMMGSTPEEIATARQLAQRLMSGDAGFMKNDLDRSLQLESPAHRVTLSSPCLMGATEITVGQFGKFVADTQYVTEYEQSDVTAAGKKKTADDAAVNWQAPGWPVTDDSPVTIVTWGDAAAFCNWLSQREKLPPSYQQQPDHDWTPVAAATGYRLPTEAEWEYACRAGTTTQFSFGDDVIRAGDYGWYRGKRGSPVGAKMPNPFGLYDMHGSEWEWCQDKVAHVPYGAAPKVDPLPSAGAQRVLRGGASWFNVWFARSADRRIDHRNISYYGFRVVRVATRLDASLSPTKATATSAETPAATANASSKPDPIGAKLAKAKEAYEHKLQTLRDGVLKALERRETTARANGDKNLVDQIKAQRTALDASGTLPTLVPTADYERQLHGARTQLEAAYKTAIKAYTKAALDDQSAAVEAELAGFLKASVP